MKSKSLIAIILAVSISIGCLGYFTFENISFAESVFSSDGYILATVDNGTAEDTANAQYYFAEGSKFLNKQDDTITLTTVNGERVNVNKENFIHYSDSSMSTMKKSVILDTDSLHNNNLVYYSISSDSLIEKRTNGYAIFNGAEVMTLQNFIWKLSEQQYMLVSDEITLVVDEGSTQTFRGFIQLLYRDYGIVYLVNQEGTYSTISSAAYLELANGIRIYIGSKNISDAEGILVNMSQMLVKADDVAAVNPDEEFRNEVAVEPKLEVNASDGADGEDGEVGSLGEAGEAGIGGEAGASGKAGDPGKAGRAGDGGSGGATGGTGLSAYQAAVANHLFSGTEEEWNNALKGNTGLDGLTAFEAAVAAGTFTGNIDDWNEALRGAVGTAGGIGTGGASGMTAYEAAVAAGTFTGDIDAWNEALKGKTGKPGDPGDPGDNGTNGQNGKNGPQGPTGKDGEDAKTAGIDYEEELAPIFRADLIPSAFGVEATVYLNNNGCVIDESKTYISIIESATGTEIWRQYAQTSSNPSGFVMTESEDGFEVNCYTLKQNRNYTFEITSTYKSGVTEETRTQLLYTKYFTTKSIGLELQVKEVGQNKIVADLIRTNDNPIKSILVQCYDKNMQKIRRDGSDGLYGMPTDPELKQNFVDYNKIMVANMDSTGTWDALNNRLELSFDSLTRNQVYYIRIEAVDIDTSVIGLDQITTESFPLIPVKTLKKEPTLGTPVVSLSVRDNAFIATPTDITDEDAGVLSYTYEVYDATETNIQSHLDQLVIRGLNGESVNPVYTVEKSVPTDVKIPIDGEHIKRGPGEAYVLRILAKFDNNETVVMYSSPLSNVFSANESAWPVLTNKIENEYLKASSVQGTITIEDESKTIDPRYGLRIEYRSSNPVNGDYITGNIEYSADELMANADIGYYEIPYFIYNLKDEQQYNILVYAGRMKSSSSAAHTDTLIGTLTFNTPGYDEMNLVLDNLKTSDVDTYGDLSFAYQLSVTSSAVEVSKGAAAATSLAKVHELYNMGLYSLKNMQAARFEIFYADTNNGDKPGAKIPESIDYVIYSDAEVTTESDNNIKGLDFYPFGSLSDSWYQVFFGRDVNIESKKAAEEKFILTPSKFNLDNKDIESQAGKYIFIKVTFYDALYRRGGNSRLYGDNNVIPLSCDNSLTVKANENDKFVYIRIKAEKGVPSMPLDRDVVQDVNKATAYSNQAGYSSGGALYSSNSNAKGSVDIFSTALWDDLYDDTAVGIKICGYDSFYGEAQAVRYEIYRNYTEAAIEGAGGVINRVYEYGDMIGASGWLPINKEQANGNCPEWVLFFDQVQDGSRISKDYSTIYIEDSSADNPSTYETDLAHATALKRGETFYVKTEFILRQGFGPEESKEYLFPTRFYNMPLEYEYYSLKQLPYVYVAEKNGLAADNAITATYYFDYADPDKALLYDGVAETYDHITFYKTSDVVHSDYNTSFGGIKIASNPDMDGNEYNPHYILSAAASSSGTEAGITLVKDAQGDWESLYVKYKLSDTGSVRSYKLIDGENIIQQGSERVVFAESDDDVDKTDLVGEDKAFRNISIEKKPDGDYVFVMYVLADDKSGLNGNRIDAIKDLNIKLTRKDDGTETDLPSNGAIEFKDRDLNKKVEIVHQGFTKTVSDGAVESVYRFNGYRIEATFDVAQILMVMGKNEFTVEASLTYDTGRYGLDYAVGKADSDVEYMIQQTSGSYIVDQVTRQPRVFSIASGESGLLTKPAFAAEAMKGISRTQKVQFPNYLNNSGAQVDVTINHATSNNVSGLSQIPRELGEATVSDTLKLEGVVANIIARVYPSVEDARINVGVSSQNFDNADPNIKVVIQKCNEDGSIISTAPALSKEWKAVNGTNISFNVSEMFPAGISLDRNSLYSISIEVLYANNWEPQGRKLKSGSTTEYEDSVFWAKDQDNREVVRVINPGAGVDAIYGFRTIKEVVPEATALTFAAKNENRNTKTATLKYMLTDVSRMDLKSVEKLTITLSSGSSVVTSVAVSGDDIRAKFEDSYSGESDETPVDLVLDPVQIGGAEGWMPDPSHVMNGKIEYTADIKVTYKTSGTSFNESSARIKSTPQSWENRNNGSYQVIRAQAKRYEASSDHGSSSSTNMAYITGNVSVNDPLRVFNPVLGSEIENYASKGLEPDRYYIVAQLVVEEENGTVPEGLFGHNSQTIYLEYNMARGTTSPQTYVFHDIPINTKTGYKVSCSIDHDFDNDGSFEGEKYKVVSSRVMTPTKDVNIQLFYVRIEPSATEPQISIYGTDLDAVGSIYYTIYQTAPVRSESSAILHVGSGGEHESRYKPITSTSNKGFTILIPENVSDPSAEYEIEIALYRDFVSMESITGESPIEPNARESGTYDSQTGSGGLLMALNNFAYNLTH